MGRERLAPRVTVFVDVIIAHLGSAQARVVVAVFVQWEAVFVDVIVAGSPIAVIEDWDSLENGALSPGRAGRPFAARDRLPALR